MTKTKKKGIIHSSGKPLFTVARQGGICMTNTVKYDVVIVGAGPGGIYAAYELSGKNLKIAVFEAGHPLSKRKCPIDGKMLNPA